MRILAAYLAIVLLWSTTPLAIKWSGEGPGHLFGVTARMCIGLACVLAILFVTGKRIPFHRKALQAYLAGFIQVFGSMLLTYWSSQFIPSGWISVVFGLVPIMTVPMANLWLKENSLSVMKVFSVLVGFIGLAIMFKSAMSFSETAVLGVIGIVIAAFFQSLSAVWIKKTNAGIPALQMVGGSLIIAVPAYLSVWLSFEGHLPEALPLSSLLSIFYLGAIATTVGFALYYYILERLPATRVALITLIVPVLSLYVGHFANQEAISNRVMAGTGLIMLALIFDQWSLPSKKRPIS